MNWPVSRLNKKQIAVIDDDDAVRRSLSAVFEQSGHVALGYANGQDFMDQAPLGLLHGIVLDLEMPIADGATVLSVLRAEACNVPVVVVTGTADSGLLRVAAGPPVVAVLRKPVGASELLTALDSGIADRTPDLS